MALTTAKAITEANDANNTPIPILIALLNAGVKSRYIWIKRFEARPKKLGHYSIHMIASDHEIKSDYTTKGKTAEKTAKEVQVTIKGTEDVVHEAAQSKRFGQLEGGGEFEFLGNSSEGIEGFFIPKGSTEKIPVSFKNMPDVKSVKGAFREMRQNVPHVINAGAKDTVLFTSLPKYTTEDVLKFLGSNKPNVLPQPGVFKKIMIDCADGVIIIDVAGVATKL